MTVTAPNASGLAGAWSSQAAIVALPSLLLPKCFACLHVYAWLTASLFGRQIEICGAPSLSGATVAAELAIVFVSLALAQRVCHALTTCARCEHL